MARRSAAVLILTLALALVPALALADNFGLNGATVAGHMHDDQGSQGLHGPAVYFSLKWQNVTNSPGTQFGLGQFDLRELVGSGPVDQFAANTVDGVTYSGYTVSVPFWLSTGENINHYPTASNQGGQGSAGVDLNNPTGYIQLTSIFFGKEDTNRGHGSDLLKLTGTVIGMESSEGGLFNGLELEFLAFSQNQSPFNQFAAKYNQWSFGHSTGRGGGHGSGDVPFGLATTATGAATPEPGTMLLLASGLGAIGFMRRRRLSAVEA